MYVYIGVLYFIIKLISLILFSCICHVQNFSTNTVNKYIDVVQIIPYSLISQVCKKYIHYHCLFRASALKVLKLIQVVRLMHKMQETRKTFSSFWVVTFWTHWLLCSLQITISESPQNQHLNYMFFWKLSWQLMTFKQCSWFLTIRMSFLWYVGQYEGHWNAAAPESWFLFAFDLLYTQQVLSRPLTASVGKK